MTIRCCAALAVVLATSLPAVAQEQGHYRDFQLGARVADVSALTDTRSADVTLVHERPALMQELRWTPSSFGGAGQSRGHGLERIAFSFYENQLYRLAVDYDRSATKGMTDHDMVNAISMMYGQPSSSKMTDGGTDGRSSDIVASRIVARWNGPGYAIALSRWAYGDAWRLVIESTSLNALARTGDARAIALDVQEGPQREAERTRREHQQQDDAEAAARTANTAKFQP